MRILAYFLTGLVLTLMSQACGTKQQAATKADSTQTALATAPAPKPIVLTERMTALGLTQTGHWRGVSLGDAMTTVAATEPDKPFEQDAAHVGYTIEFPNLESADFLYYQQKGKVSAIEVDLYLNTRSSVEAYTKDLTSYFDQRYGPAAKSGNVLVWTGPKNEKITLKDVSKGKDYGLKIRVAPADEAKLTASVNK